jgi:sporulation protein YlmC with PRC-barrel domain
MNRSRTALAVAALSIAALAGPAAATQPTFVAKQQAGEWLAHRLVGTDVLNGQAEKIGTVKDVVLDAKGQATTVVVGVGGFLGIPEKLVAVPFGQIQVGDVVQSSRVVVLDASKDALKAAPAYEATDPGTTERVQQRASDWYGAAKAKVMELTKAAAEKAKEISAPKDPAGQTPAPAPAPAPKQ